MVQNKKAFSLIELIIVVTIIGIVYAVVLNSFKSTQNITYANFANLKDKFLPFWKRGSLLEFYIYDNCSKSILFLNSNKLTNQPDFDIKMFKEIKVYKTDRFAEAKKVEFAPLKFDNKLYSVCFKYTIFPNGSSSSYIVKLLDNYYIMYPYMMDTKVATTLNEAVDLFLNKELIKIVSYEK